MLDETVRKEGEEKGGKGERGRREREEGNKEEEIKKKRRGKSGEKKDLLLTGLVCWYSAEEK